MGFGTIEKEQMFQKEMDIQTFHIGFSVLFFAMEYWKGFDSTAWSGKTVLVTLFV